MARKLTRTAYEELIEGDLAWLNRQPRTLEREHVRKIVMRSADHEYDGGAAPDLLAAAEAALAYCDDKSDHGVLDKSPEYALASQLRAAVAKAKG